MGKIVNSYSYHLSAKNHWKSHWYHLEKRTNLIFEDHLIHQYIENIFKRVNIPINNLVIKRTSQSILLSINISNFFSLEKTNLGLFFQKAINYLSALLKQPITLYYITTKNLTAASISFIILYYIKKGKSLQYAFNKILQKTKKNSIIAGIKIEMSGRPKKMDMARTEWVKYGEIPLHTYKKNIDFHQSNLILKYGTSNIKVWLNIDYSKK